MVNVKISMKNMAHTEKSAIANEEYLQELISGLVGEDIIYDVTGVPLYIEAAAWCSLASVGEVFDCDYFSIEIKDKL